MSNFSDYLNSLGNKSIRVVAQCLGYEIDSKLSKKDMISSLSDSFEKSPETWLQRLPVLDQEILKILIQNGPDYKLNLNPTPYELLIIKLHIVCADTSIPDRITIYLPKKIYNSIKDIAYSIFSSYYDKGYTELETYLWGILSAHGVIEVEEIKDILKRVDKDSVDKFISNSMLIRFYLIKRDMDKIYAYHPAITNPNKILNFWNENRKHIRKRKFSLKEYYSYGEKAPFITMGYDSRNIKMMLEQIKEYGYDEKYFPIIYHALFIASNNGDFSDINDTIEDIELAEEDEKERRKTIEKLVFYLLFIPQWCLGCKSFNDLRHNKWFLANNKDFVKEYWDQGFEEIDEDSEISEEDILLNTINNKNIPES